MAEQRVFQSNASGTTEVKAHNVAETPGTFDAHAFSTHVLSLNAAALLQMGAMADPSGAEVELDLEASRHLIETLAMLREKTRGNLTVEESSLLDTVLHELRVQFVRVR